MKKQLLCTSAIALGVAAAAPASAQSWDLEWGGYYQSHVVLTDAGGPGNAGTDFDGINIYSDTEIHFDSSITLDNGLTFGAHIELEGQSAAGNQIDETYLHVSGDSLGTIKVGNLNSQSYKTSWQTPGVGSIGIDSGTMSAFVPLLVFPTAHNDMTADSTKISYTTPDFNGLTLDLSYTPNVAGNSINTGPINRNVGLNDVYDISVNYNGNFGTTSVGLHASYQQGDNATANTDPNIWQLGLNVGFGDFAIGANYSEVDADVTGSSVGDSTAWTLGMTYDMPGPWMVGFDYINHEFDAIGTGGADIEEEAYRIGAAREIGPGVTWDMFAIIYDGDDKGASGAGSPDIDATLIGTALTLSF